MSIGNYYKAPRVTSPLKIGSQVHLMLTDKHSRAEISSDGKVFSILNIPVRECSSCQTQGIVPETECQEEDGPSLKDCFNLLRAVSSAPVIDLARLLDGVIFNYLVGNNDAHGKYFSLVYPGAGTGDLEVRLAPLYDVVSAIYYPELSPEMAMRIGGEYFIRTSHAKKLREACRRSRTGQAAGAAPRSGIGRCDSHHFSKA